MLVQPTEAAAALRAATEARVAFERAATGLAQAGRSLQPGPVADAIAGDLATAASATRQLDGAPVGLLPDGMRTMVGKALDQTRRMSSLTRSLPTTQWFDFLHAYDVPASALESAQVLLDTDHAAAVGGGDAVRGAAVLHARSAAARLERAAATIGEGGDAARMQVLGDAMTARALIGQVEHPEAKAWSEQARSFWATVNRSGEVPKAPATADTVAADVASRTEGIRAAARGLRAAAADGTTSTLRLSAKASSYETRGLVHSAAELDTAASAAWQHAKQVGGTGDEAAQLAVARSLAGDARSLQQDAMRIYGAAQDSQMPIGAASAGQVQANAWLRLDALLQLPVMSRMPEAVAMDAEELEHAARTGPLAQSMHVQRTLSSGSSWQGRFDRLVAGIAVGPPAGRTATTHPTSTVVARMVDTASSLRSRGAALDLTGWRSDRVGTRDALRAELQGWHGMLQDADAVHALTQRQVATEGRGIVHSLAGDLRGAFASYNGRMREIHGSDLGQSLPEGMARELEESTAGGIIPIYPRQHLERILAELDAMPTIAEPTAASHPTRFASLALARRAAAPAPTTIDGIAEAFRAAAADGHTVLVAPTTNPSRKPGIAALHDVLDALQASLTSQVAAREHELPIETLDAWAKVDIQAERMHSFFEPGRLDSLRDAASGLATTFAGSPAAGAVDAATADRLRAASQALRDLSTTAGDTSRAPRERLEDVVRLAESVSDITRDGDPAVAWRTTRVRQTIGELNARLAELRDVSVPFDGATRRALRAAQNELEYARGSRFGDDRRNLLADAREALQPVLALRQPGGILGTGSTLRYVEPGDLAYMRGQLDAALASFAAARPVEDDYKRVGEALPHWQAALASMEDTLIAGRGTLLPDDVTTRMLKRVDEASRQVEAAQLQFERQHAVGESTQPRRGLLGYVRSEAELLRELVDAADAPATI